MAALAEYTNGDACDIIVDEGVGYAVQHYCDGKYFKDPETAALWDAAGQALDTLVKHLIAETGRDDIG